VRGGKDCSIDGVNVRQGGAGQVTLYLCSLTCSQEGLTHAFVVEFESVEDRDYYAKKDPRHAAFGAHVGKVAARVVVVDFTNYVF